MENNFKLFLESVAEENRPFVQELHDFLTQKECKCEIKSAKSGYVVSYLLNSTKRTLATFVFRKSGVKLRIFPNHISQYQDFLNTLPTQMKKDIQKASACKRLINPDDCNSRCAMGYRFTMDKEGYEKCRYMAFMFSLNQENNPYIREFLERELEFCSYAI